MFRRRRRLWTASWRYAATALYRPGPVFGAGLLSTVVLLSTALPPASPGLVATAYGAPNWGIIWPSEVNRVEQGLASEQVRERRSAAARLGALPESFTRRLLPTAMSDSDPEVKATAAEVAVSRGLGEFAPLTSGWLTDRDVRVRVAAARLLGVGVATDASVRTLARALADSDRAVRLAAAVALGQSEHPEAAPALLGHLDDADTGVQLRVISSLVALGDQRAVVPLTTKVRDTRMDVRSAVARGLGLLGGEAAARALLSALEDDAPAVRMEAVTALGRLRYGASAGVVVRLAESDLDSGVKDAAVRALGMMQSDEAIRALIRLADEQTGARQSLAQGELSRTAVQVPQALLQCLKEQTSRGATSACARALAHGDDSATPAAILEAWNKGKIPTELAFDVLGELGARMALPEILQGLTDAQASVRLSAVRALGHLLDSAEPDGRALEPLAQALEQAASRPQESLALLELIGRTGAARAAPVVLPYASSTRPRFRLAAIRALGQLGAARGFSADARPRVDQALLDAMLDPIGAVRWEAALATRRAGGAELAQALLVRAESTAGLERELVLLALAGPVGQGVDPDVLGRIFKLARRAEGGEEDLLIEVLAHGRDATQQLRRLADVAAPAQRAKIAEVLALRADAAPWVRQLARDSRVRVSANAIWSLGTLGSAPDLALLSSLTQHREAAVAANAVASFARVAQRASAPESTALCEIIEHSSHAYARANAVAGLALLNGRCPEPLLLARLRDDRSAAVREQAALLLRTMVASTTVRAALERCAARDVDGRVAAACLAHEKPRTARGTMSTVVLVTNRGSAKPEPSVPATLVLSNGLRRLAISDRRGGVFEASAPLGELRLDPPISDEISGLVQ